MLHISTFYETVNQVKHNWFKRDDKTILKFTVAKPALRAALVISYLVPSLSLNIQR